MTDKKENNVIMFNELQHNNARTKSWKSSLTSWINTVNSINVISVGWDDKLASELGVTPGCCNCIKGKIYAFFKMIPMN